MDILYDAGYDVIEAANGSIALEKAQSEKPDLILLDVSMPVMDGWEVLKRLKENAVTMATRVAMVTRIEPAQGELAAWRLGSKHYIAKPFRDEHVKLAVRVALREAEESAADEAPVAEEETSDDSERRSVIGTGNHPLDQIMGGGIALGSLTFIEGTQSTGKSVLCQHITYESLLDGHGVAYFTYESATEGLVAQMGSIGLQASDYLDSDQLKIYSINGPTLDDDSECDLNPERLVSSLAPELGRLPAEDNVIILDDITDLSSESDDRNIIRFFTSCKRLCEMAGLSSWLLGPTRSMTECMDAFATFAMRTSAYALRISARNRAPCWRYAKQITWN